MKFPVRAIAGLVVGTSVLFASALPVRADLFTFAATLTGAQEVPANNSQAQGTATITLDTSTDRVTVSGNWFMLSGAVNQVTLNGLAGPGSTSSTLLNFSYSGVNQMGTFGSSSILMGIPLANGMINNQTYLNITTSAFSGGEIRGQVLRTPEPAGVVLLGIGALICGGMWLRRRHFSPQAFDGLR
jgi:CHRD domain